MGSCDVDVPGMLRALGIEARARGVELWSPCPIHEEKTPSWSIKNAPGADGNGSHYCWGCGFEGGPIELIVQVVGLSGYSAAKQWLIEHGLILGTSIPASVDIAIRTVRGRQAVRVPNGVRLQSLEQWITPARRYAISRGITSSQVTRWGLGYGIDGRLACRIFLPSRDNTGRIASWTGRAYAGQTPKYLDPHSDDSPDRSVVFGEAFWPAPQARSNATLVLCEGELNALACERAGQRYVGALGGSGLDRGQALRIATFGRVIVATDVDQAGSKVALQLRSALVRWRGCSRVMFPPRRDACDIEEEQGSTALAELIQKAG